jgi:hypothetical protein
MPECAQKRNRVYSPSRDPTYAPEIQTLCVIGGLFVRNIGGWRTDPAKLMAAAANRLQAQALGDVPSRVLDKSGHFRSKVGFKACFPARDLSVWRHDGPWLLQFVWAKKR